MVFTRSPFRKPSKFPRFALHFLNMYGTLGGKIAPRLHASDFRVTFGSFWALGVLFGVQEGPKSTQEAQNVDFEMI